MEEMTTDQLIHHLTRYLELLVAHDKTDEKTTKGIKKRLNTLLGVEVDHDNR